MTELRKAESDVKLEEELSYRDRLPEGSSFYEFSGALILGEAQGHDIAFISMPINVGGPVWLVEDTFFVQTQFIAIPQESPIVMRDIETVGNRNFPTEWPAGGTHIIQKDDAVIWEVGNRRHICRPPYWEIKGEHIGVDCDILMGGLGNAASTFGDWADVNTTQRAGLDQPCWAEGTFKVGGTTYTLEKAYGVHERLLWGDISDYPQTFKDAPYFWIWVVSDSIRASAFICPKLNYGFAHVHAEGKEIPFSVEDIGLTPLEWWVDPKNQMYVPHRWHLNMNSENGVFDVELTAGSRLLFNYATRSGVTTHHGMVGRANGRFFFTDGHSMSVENVQMWVEQGYTTIPFGPGV